MFRRKKAPEAAPSQASQPQAPQGPPPQASSGGSFTPGAFQRSELVVFDGKGNPKTMVYTYDAAGKMIVTPKRGRAKRH